MSELNKDGSETGLINVYRIKPMSKMDVLDAINGAEKVVVVEEHNILGGLGSILSEIMAEEGIGKRLYRIGLNDCFAVGNGAHRAVRQENGLDAGSIYRRIRDIIYE